MTTLSGVFRRTDLECSPEILNLLMDAMPDNHPDCNCTWTENGVGLGSHTSHYSGGEKTKKGLYAASETGQVITADARLDDRSSLIKTLALPSSESSITTDSQLIIHAYRKWGPRCPEHLYGDFAFAIWDPEIQALFCARDHIGVKPFYYHLSPDLFIFASTLKAVANVPGVGEQLDEAFVAAKLQHGAFTHATHTFLTSIQKLPPGHSLLVTRTACHVERYWSIGHLPDIRFESDRDYADAFLDLLTTAVTDRVDTEERVGVHVSGGLDSSSIAVLAGRELRRQNHPLPPAFCWHPPPGRASSNMEQTFTREICDQSGLKLSHQSLTSNDILSVLQLDPVYEPVENLMHERLVLQQAADQGVRVLLSGWGGDEGIAFNGRGYLAELMRRGQWRRLYQTSKGYGDYPWKFIMTLGILPLLPGGHRLNERISRRFKASSPSYINPDFARNVKPYASNPYREVGVQQTQWQLLQLGHLTDRMESWHAHGTRHGITYRYPLLDRRILEFALGLPPEQFRRGKWGRYLMRSALDGILPSKVCWQPALNEPDRINRIKSVLPEALKAIKLQLETRTTPPVRSKYLDMPRLMKDLDYEDPERIKPGRLMNALQFLDF